MKASNIKKKMTYKTGLNDKKRKQRTTKIKTNRKKKRELL